MLLVSFRQHQVAIGVMAGISRSGTWTVCAVRGEITRSEMVSQPCGHFSAERPRRVLGSQPWCFTLLVPPQVELFNSVLTDEIPGKRRMVRRWEATADQL